MIQIDRTFILSSFDKHILDTDAISRKKVLVSAIAETCRLIEQWQPHTRGSCINIRHPEYEAKMDT